MAEKPDHRLVLTRRAALAGLAAAATCGVTTDNRAIAQPAVAAENGAGPVFSATGPNAELYGAAEGFPVPGLLARRQGNPYEPRYRVGAFSHLDEFLTTRLIKHAATPWMFKRSAADVSYSYRGKPSSLTEYLSRNPVTGLLIARDD
jgi:hypothetical protein